MTLSPAILRNLRDVYDAASASDIQAGMLWYPEAYDIASRIARESGFTLPAVVGAIAAISPGCEWQRNVSEARRIIAAYPEPIVAGSYGNRNVQKALYCLDGQEPLTVLGGPKVTAFYACILNPLERDAVVVDRHMKCAANMAVLGEKESLVRPHEYDWYASHVRKLASKRGITPAQFQAITWHTWRKYGLAVLNKAAIAA